MPAFYNLPETIDDLVNHSVGRILDLFDLDAGIIKRWQGKVAPSATKEDLPAPHAEPQRIMT